MPISSMPQARPVIRHEIGTQKLIRCEMLHPNGQSSVRFTSVEVFLLWEHMMRTRHEMECKDYTISLWIPAREFESRSPVFSHSGEIEPVNRFDFSLYDDIHHYTYRATRFVLDSDSDQFQAAMRSHLPAGSRCTEQLEVEIIPGYCIEKEKSSHHNRFILGLFSDLNEIG